MAGRPRGADPTADEWAELRRVDGTRLLLRRRNADFEINESTQWWRQYLDKIDECLKRGQILVHVKSNQVDRLVLVNGGGSRTTIHKPWKLW